MAVLDVCANSVEADQAIALLQQMVSMGEPAQFGKSSECPVGEGNVAWQAETRYRSLIERLPVVTFMASLDERMQELYVSPQIETLLGFTQEEWLDNPILWFQQLHPDDRERWVTEFARTCSNGATFKAEYRMLARDGHIVWIQGECQIIRDDYGRPIFLQGVAFDITHLKKTAEIEEAKLAAEAANRAKSEFLARMSHEIRTPLNGVVGMLDLLLATEMNENQQRYAHLAREAADALMNVINDILDFSKIEAGKVEIESVEFDPHKVMEDLTELLAPIAAKKGLALGCMIKPDVPRRCLGDPNRIRQILTNLVNNALKFTARGSVNIRAAVESSSDEHITVKVIVEDTGIGIPADRLDRLFKSFSQVDSSTTRKYGGTGLGLAISKRLVELMGGEIGIESTVGVGTRFCFTLKLAKSANDDDLDHGDRLRQTRVLSVEGQPVYRKILSEQIEGLVSPESKVVDASQALPTLLAAEAEGSPYTVALVPYGTPEDEILRLSIRNRESLKGLKLVAILDMDATVDSDAIEKARFSSSLRRPITQSRFIDAIAEASLAATESIAVTPASGDTAQNNLQGLHLLVAEDNEMNQFVTRETLKRAGCTCDVVGDGALALEASAKKRYDLILMDCQMPGMDGLEATIRIRERELADGEPRIPIIALTAEAIQGDREKCLAAGMDDYVTKPINAGELFRAIGALKSNTPAPTTTPTAPAAAPALPSIEDPFDLAALLKRCMKDAKFAVNTLIKFRERACSDVQLLQQRLAGSDGQSIQNIAHNLKSAAAHVGANPLRRIANDIEQLSTEFNAEALSQKLLELNAEVKRCAEYIPQAIEDLSKAEEGSCKS